MQLRGNRVDRGYYYVLNRSRNKQHNNNLGVHGSSVYTKYTRNSLEQENRVNRSYGVGEGRWEGLNIGHWAYIFH